MQRLSSLSQNPDLSEVRKLMMEKDFPKKKVLIKYCEDLLNKLDQSFKRNAEIYGVRAEMYLLIGTETKEDSELKTAIVWALHSLNINPDYTHAKLTLARAYFQLKDYKKAEDILDPLLIKNKNYDARLLLNKIYEIQGERQKLYSSLQKTLELKETAGTYFQLAIVTNQLNYYKASRNHATYALEKLSEEKEASSKDWIAVYALRAEVNNNRKKYQKAREDANTAISFGNTNKEAQSEFEYKKAHLERAGANYYLGENPEQIMSDVNISGILNIENKEFTKDTKINCYLWIGRFYLRSNKFAEALEIANSLLRLVEEQKDALVETQELFIEIYFEQGNFDEVIKITSNMINLINSPFFSPYENWYAFRALAFFKKKDFMRAEEDATSYIRSCRSITIGYSIERTVKLYFCLAVAQFEQGKFAEAESTLNSILQSKLGSDIAIQGQVHLLRAEQYFKKYCSDPARSSELLSSALENVQAAIKLDNKNITAFELRAKIYHKLEKPEKALRDEAEAYFFPKRKKMLSLFDITKFYILKNARVVEENLGRIETNLFASKRILTQLGIKKSNLAITISDHLLGLTPDKIIKQKEKWKSLEAQRKAILEQQQKNLKYEEENLKNEAELLDNLKKQLNSPNPALTEITATLFARQKAFKDKAYKSELLTSNPEPETPKSVRIP